MFEVLFTEVAKRVALTNEEEDICKTLFIPKKLRKKQHLLHQDDVCKYLAFVEKGVLRSYSISEDGVEHVMQFGLEGYWISDMYSFLSQEPSTYNIEALEDSEVLLISNPDLEELYQQIPKFERYFRILSQNNILALHKRLISSHCYTAEEKYVQLLNNFPTIVNRVPQHMIASYLGITRETLSRIRKQIVQKK